MGERREHLIIQTAFLGDLLLGIPLFKELRRMKANDKLTLLCRSGVGKLLVQLELVDEAIEVDKNSQLSWKKARLELQKRNFATLICPHESIRSQGIAWRLRADQKIGYRNFYNRFLFHNLIKRAVNLPEAVRQLQLLTPLNEVLEKNILNFSHSQKLAGGRVTYESLMPVPSWASMAVDKLVCLRDTSKGNQHATQDITFDNTAEKYASFSKMASAKALEVANEFGLLGKQNVIFLAPGSVWKTKMWMADGFGQVARDFLAEGHRVVVIGSFEEKSICDEIVFRAPGAITIAGRITLFELAELLTIGSVLISNDSGAMHLAAAAGLPNVAVFGPTVLEFGYRPWQNEALVVQIAEGELKCRPCGTHGARICPISTHDCMRRISPNEVLLAAQKVMRP